MKKHKLMTFLLDLWDYSTENGKEVLPPKVVLRSKILTCFAKNDKTLKDFYNVNVFVKSTVPYFYISLETASNPSKNFPVTSF